MIRLRASAAALARGRVWLLATSALEPQPPLAAAQVMATAAAAGALVRRDGLVVWARAASAAHVGSALVSYAAIGAGVLAGSSGTRRAAHVDDHGVSCVLLGSVGALLRGRPAALAVATAAAAVLPADDPWLGVQHPLAVVLGAAAARRPC